MESGIKRHTQRKHNSFETPKPTKRGKTQTNRNRSLENSEEQHRSLFIPMSLSSSQARSEASAGYEETQERNRQPREHPASTRGRKINFYKYLFGNNKGRSTTTFKPDETVPLTEVIKNLPMVIAKGDPTHDVPRCDAKSETGHKRTVSKLNVSEVEARTWFGAAQLICEKGTIDKLKEAPITTRNHLKPITKAIGSKLQTASYEQMIQKLPEQIGKMSGQLTIIEGTETTVLKSLKNNNKYVYGYSEANAYLPTQLDGEIKTASGVMDPSNAKAHGYEGLPKGKVTFDGSMSITISKQGKAAQIKQTATVGNKEFDFDNPISNAMATSAAGTIGKVLIGDIMRRANDETKLQKRNDKLRESILTCLETSRPKGLGNYEENKAFNEHKNDVEPFEPPELIKTSQKDYLIADTLSKLISHSIITETKNNANLNKDAIARIVQPQILKLKTEGDSRQVTEVLRISNELGKQDKTMVLFNSPDLGCKGLFLASALASNTPGATILEHKGDRLKVAVVKGEIDKTAPLNALYTIKRTLKNNKKTIAGNKKTKKSIRKH